jgi:hypothetical protein
MYPPLARYLLLFTTLCFWGCATFEKELDRKQLESNEEFEQVIKIESIPPVEPAPRTQKEQDSSETIKQPTPPKTMAQPSAKKAKVKDPIKQIIERPSPPDMALEKKQSLKPPRQPEIEDDEGFNGRRPLIEPYSVGEEVVMGLSYFGVEAGKFTMKVEPMVNINGKKAYHFKYIIQSSPLFNMVYRVNDVAETFVEYDSLLPLSYEIHVDESKQVRETRTFFDQENNKATMWDRKQKVGGALEKKKIEWDLEEYSQNVFSAAYYLRNFTLRVGKKLQVHVGHEGKNILMTAEVLRKEKLFTPAGAFETFVVKPSFDIDGKFKPTGENYLWLTADDRKFIVRLESKIKIGSIVGQAQKIKEK